MKRINILPKEIALEYRYKSRWTYLIRKYFTRFLLAIIILEISLFGIIHGMRGLRLNTLNNSFKKVKEEIGLVLVKLNNKEEELARIKREIEDIDKRIKEAEEKFTFLASIRKKPKDYSDILAEVNIESPRKIWITYLSTKGDKLNMIGGSYSTLLVTRFMSNLQQSPFFANADFEYTKKSEIEKVEVIEFEISCDVIRGRK